MPSLGARQKKIRMQTNSAQGRIVLFTGEHNEGADLANHLRDLGKNVIMVHPGKCFEHSEPATFYVGVEEPQFDSLVNAIGKGSWSQVIFEPSFINNIAIQDLEELNETQQRGVYSLFYLVRALNRHGTEHDVDLVVLTRNVHHVTGKSRC